MTTFWSSCDSQIEKKTENTRQNSFFDGFSFVLLWIKNLSLVSLYIYTLLLSSSLSLSLSSFFYHDRQRDKRKDDDDDDDDGFLFFVFFVFFFEDDDEKDDDDEKTWGLFNEKNKKKILLSR